MLLIVVVWVMIQGGLVLCKSTRYGIITQKAVIHIFRAGIEICSYKKPTSFLLQSTTVLEQMLQKFLLESINCGQSCNKHHSSICYLIRTVILLLLLSLFQRPCILGGMGPYVTLANMLFLATFLNVSYGLQHSPVMLKGNSLFMH